MFFFYITSTLWACARGGSGACTVLCQLLVAHPHTSYPAHTTLPCRIVHKVVQAHAVIGPSFFSQSETQKAKVKGLVQDYVQQYKASNKR